MLVLETAENKKDEKLLQRIRGFDFFECEAGFHSSCRRQYQRSSTHWRSASEENKRGHEDLRESRRSAFTKVSDVIGKKSFKVKESRKFRTRVKFTYLLWNRQSTQNQVTKQRN